MPSHTLPLQGRTGPSPRLSGEEAVEMLERGFRFAVFRPGVEECRLSLPIETVIDFDTETLTIRQPDRAR